MAKILGNKPKIAIFDLTDCEGCELEFIALREKLTKTLGQIEIANWRLASHNSNLGPFDFTFIEGSPISETDIELVKQARAASRVIITLGSCAEFGGVQASLDQNEWAKGLKEVYGKDYKTKSKPPRPVSYYIPVDYHLPGCPINKNNLEEMLTCLFINKKPSVATYPVCLECKAAENSCLLLEGQPCLGPVTTGGCEAICPSRGLRCWGCYGTLKGGNITALKNLFENKFGEERTYQLLKIFFASQDEFKALYVNKMSPKVTTKTKKSVKVKVKG